MTRQEKNSRYRQIQTLEGLDAEISGLHRRNAAMEEDLKLRLGSMPEVYTPRAIAREGLNRAAHSINFYGFALGAISLVRKLLRKR